MRLIVLQGTRMQQSNQIKAARTMRIMQESKLFPIVYEDVLQTSHKDALRNGKKENNLKNQSATASEGKQEHKW